MANKKRTKNVQSLVTRSLEVEKISITIGSKPSYTDIFSKIAPSTATPQSMSVSVFKYEGQTWEGGSIFMGFCETLGKGILLFTGENAQKLFQDFRTLLLNQENKDLFQNLTFEASLVVGVPLESPQTKTEVQALFEKLLQVQKTKNPKIAIDKNGNFYIGGKTTSNYIRISGNFELKADDLSTTRVLRLDVKFRGGLDFFMVLANNKEIGINSLTVYSVLKKISKIKFVGVLSEMQNIFVSQPQYGKIAEPIYDETKPKTKVGKTVSRSLAAVENKMKDFETSKETAQIFQRWLANLVKQFKVDPTYEQFLKECGKCFENQLETGTTSQQTGTTRTRSRQSIPTENEKTE